MELPIRNIIMHSYVIVLTGIVIAGLLTYKGIESIAESDSWVKHTQEVIYQTEQIFSLTKDISISTRTFAITNDTSFLGSLGETREIISNRLSDLKKLMQDHPIQLKRADTLQELIKERIEFALQTIEKRRRMGFDEAQNQLATGKSEFYLARIQNIIQHILQEEKRLMDQRKLDNEKSNHVFTQSFYTLLGCIIVMLVISFLTISNSWSEKKKSEGKLHALFETAPDAMIIVNKEGKVQMANTQTENLFGFSRDEILNQTVEILLPQKFAESHAKHRQHFFQRPAIRYMGAGLDLFGRKKNGVEFPVEVSLSPLEWDRGKSVSAAIRDITERKKAESRIRFLSTIAENIQDPIIVTDLNYKIIQWNNAAEELLGWRSEEVLGRQTMDILNVTYPNDSRAEAMTLFAQNKYWQGEVIYHSKSGEQLDIRVSLSQMKDADGEATGIIALARDITKQKIAERELNKLNEDLEKRVLERSAALVESEAFNRGVLNSLSVHVAVIDTNGSIVAVNDIWDRFFQENGETTLQRAGVGCNYFEVCNRAARSGDRYAGDVLQGLGDLKGGRVDLFELEYPCDSPHQKRWFNMRALRFKNDKPMIVMVHTDVTERKEAELKIRESEERFRLLYENSQEAILLTRPDGTIIAANPEACKIFGRTEEEICNAGREGLIQQDEIVDIGLKQRRETGKMYAEWNFFRKDGTVFPGELTSTVFINAHGEQRASVSIRDISERKKVEDKLKELNETLEKKVEERTEQLRKVNQELEAFSYSVSHDLRAPLRSINGFASILVEDYGDKLDEQGKSVVSTIIKNGNRMGQLIDDMLNFSRVGRVAISAAVVDMDKLVRKILSELPPVENSRTQIEVGKLELAKCDLDMITQVWINYILNAIKFSSKTDVPIIKIGSDSTDHHVVYFVKDNGAGFDNKYVSKLFGVFQRLHKQSEFDGTGVGLAIVKRIVEKHGGQVWAEGLPNRGASFYFSLPKKLNKRL